MADWLALLLLAIAVSLDGFGVGFTYGLRKMKIPFRSLMIIASCSALVLLSAMGIGSIIGGWISPHLAESLGGVILILIGAWMIYRLKHPNGKKSKNNQMIVNFEIKSLGIVIQVLEKPMVADFDESGTITGIEALILGLALSMDAFGAGISAALLGYSPLFLAISIACMSSIFVLSGMKCGLILSKIKWMERFSLIPGVLLIVLGIFKF
ncbi:sporulation membrane protein YtaF [Pueribacillus theae]|uniref:Sporulation membrane protein YtaF n=1 Tax=Pueribacillus theae TaxID=2171751 RepID=A0A2U1JKF0_9BACI|nr:sporulation membrane protein YtaF [Pueribacillus theae]PWA05459.1 sporulation membrane protein YtaF [Pueribacillus theae]